MKKFKFLSMAFMALMMAASFAACSNDDDEYVYDEESSFQEMLSSWLGS